MWKFKKCTLNIVDILSYNDGSFVLRLNRDGWLIALLGLGNVPVSTALADQVAKLFPSSST